MDFPSESESDLDDDEKTFLETVFFTFVFRFLHIFRQSIGQTVIFICKINKTNYLFFGTFLKSESSDFESLDESVWITLPLLFLRRSFGLRGPSITSFADSSSEETGGSGNRVISL